MKFGSLFSDSFATKLGIQNNPIKIINRILTDMQFGEELKEFKTMEKECLKDLSDSGFQLLFIFINKISCDFTKKLLQDILSKYDSILKTNTIPVIIYIDKESFFQDYFSTSGGKLYTKLFTYQDNKLREKFKLKDKQEEIKKGKKLEEEFGMFLIHSGKVVKTFTTFDEDETPDLLRFIIESEVTVSIRPKKSFKKIEISNQKDYQKVNSPKNPIIELSKEKKKNSGFKWQSSPFSSLDSTEEYDANLDNVLATKEWRHYFKLFLAQEYALENITFIEKVEEFKTNKNNRGILVNEIIETHFTQDSINEVNAPTKLVEILFKNIGNIRNNEFPNDLFDPIVNHLKLGPLMDSYSRFVLSDLYFEMQNCKVTKNLKRKVIKK